VSEVGVTEETLFQRFVADTEALTGMRRYEMGVPMRDRTELAGDVYLHAEADHGSVPAINSIHVGGQYRSCITLPDETDAARRGKP
jgi:predicted acyl esterase